MDPQLHLEALDQANARISALARDGGMAEPVPHLNRWKVRDVIAHLGGVQRWATRIVDTRSMAGPSFTKSKLDGSALCDWFDEGAASLVAQLNECDPLDPCPNFNPGSERNVAWWIRRQAQEATVHRWDVEKAFDCTTPIAARLAAHGLEEFLDVFLRTRGKQTLDSTLVVRTTRPKRVWTLTPAQKPGRVDVHVAEPDGAGLTAAAEVSGKPEALLLAFWGRHTITDANLSIVGDIAVVKHLMKS